MKTILCSLIALSILLTAACEQETPVAELPATGAIQTDTLRILCSIGEELGDSTNTFGILSDAEYHEPTGNILVLDSGRSCLKEYTPDGEYIRQISRQGDGPGELSVASFEFFQMNGKTLVNNMNKQGFVVFDDSLNYVEEIQHWTQNPPLQCIAISDSTFAAYKPDFAEGDDQSFILYRRLAIFTYDTAEYDTVLWSDSTEFTMAHLIANGTSDMINDFLLGLTVGGSSEIILLSLCESEEYTVIGFNPDGSEALTIIIDLEPVAKTEEEIADEKAYMEGFFNQMGAQGMQEFNPEPYRDMVKKVAIGPYSTIWVQRGTSERPLFDIYDLDGILLGHKVFQETGWSWQFSISEQGILAWEDDPELGYQQLYTVDCGEPFSSHSSETRQVSLLHQ